MFLLAEILWIWAAARIVVAAGRSRPAKKLEDKAASEGDRELTMLYDPRGWLKCCHYAER
jgi:hypothetical protein